jgi:hypothetical protein
MPRREVFLLSPAAFGGRRAGILLRPEADFELARRLRTQAGAPLGEVFAFMSGLYFRGKLLYARTFARPPTGDPGTWIIAPGLGLADPDRRVRVPDLRAMAEVPVSLREPRYRDPLLRDARALATRLDPGDRAILLGSIATDKYLAPLEAALGDRLWFPSAFVGRGDMSRGGLLLRQVDAGRPLDCIRVAGAPRRGARPARLAPRGRP